ncbi:MAG TPA: PAS domain S-box protein [Kiritimatiellia bacterium]|nr:PAS domain S-box protein [Kiritimatiellia bacterium]
MDKKDQGGLSARPDGVVKSPHGVRFAEELAGFCDLIYPGIRDRFGVANVYVAVFNDLERLVVFPYFKDDRDPSPSPRRPERGMTDYVLFEGRVLWWGDEVSRRTFEQLGYERLGTLAADWIGVPLVRSGEVFGMIAVQSYEPGFRFTSQHLEEMMTIASHLSSYIYLKTHEGRLHLQDRAIEATFDGIIIVDAQLPDLPIVFVNPAFEKITGYRRQDVMGRNCRFLHMNDRHQDGLQEIRSALQDGRSATVLLRNYRKSGERFWNELHIAPIHDGSGRVTHYVGIQHDITRRVFSEQALSDSETRFRGLFEHSPTGTALCDRKGTILLANRRLSELLSQPACVLVGTSILDLASEASRVHLEEMNESLHADSDHVEAREVSLMDSKGGGRDVLLSAARIDGLGWGGGACQIWQAEDLRPVHEAERGRERLVEAIRQADEMFVITDAGGGIEYVNPAFERITGYRADEVMGKNPRILKSGLHDEAFYREMWGVLSAGRTWKGRLTNRSKRGELIEESVTISPVRDATGEVAHYVCVKLDVTKEAQLQRQLQHASKMRVAGEVAGAMAHDVKNLLVKMREKAELVRREQEVASVSTEVIDDLLASAVAIEALLHRVLTFSRSSETTMNLININDVLNGMRTLLKRIAGESVELDFRLSADSCVITGDAAQIEEVVVNLVANAREALEGAGRIVVETGTNRLEDMNRATWVESPVDPVDRWVYLRVRDTGRGIDKAIQSRIFEPFFTTKRDVAGAGLGLATVSGIVKQHNGFLSLDSSPGKGASFTVLLPLASDQAHIHEKLDEGTDLPRGEETILVVEDDQAARRIVCRILSELGYKVLEASCGADGIRLALQHGSEIDLLFTDVILPDFDGKTLADQVCDMVPGIKVVYTSGYPDTYLSDSGILGGTFRLIRKPFDLREIATSLRSALDG